MPNINIELPAHTYENLRHTIDVYGGLEDFLFFSGAGVWLTDPYGVLEHVARGVVNHNGDGGEDADGGAANGEAAGAQDDEAGAGGGVEGAGQAEAGPVVNNGGQGVNEGNMPRFHVHHHYFYDGMPYVHPAWRRLGAGANWIGGIEWYDDELF